MHIPLDQLYHWIEGVLPNPAIVYRFDPPGEKSITNLTFLRQYSDLEIHSLPAIICHDQEPLFYDLYSDHDISVVRNLHTVIDIPENELSKQNLRAVSNPISIYDNVLLLHSEKNSKELDRYQQQGYIGVHYWAHAVIAKDWFRFAQIDTRLTQNFNVDQLFLIYNRDWTGTREYRLKFLHLLEQNTLLPWCRTSVLKTENIMQHQFKNKEFALYNFEFLKNVDHNKVGSTASADYDADDIVKTGISVVLETVFDDTRIHLTEKTLRPIACGHPFILAAGPGSLEYVKSYGFKTFDPWIDESYDSEPDSLRRLEKIISSMKKLQALPDSERRATLCEIYKIAEFNKNWFFSEQFDHVVKNELVSNLKSALAQVQVTRGKNYLYRRNRAKTVHTDRRRVKLLTLRRLRQQLPP